MNIYTYTPQDRILRRVLKLLRPNPGGFNINLSPCYALMFVLTFILTSLTSFLRLHPNPSPHLFEPSSFRFPNLYQNAYQHGSLPSRQASQTTGRKSRALHTTRSARVSS